MNDMNDLSTVRNTTTLTDGRADQHPAAVYLASLAPGSRRAMREALDTIARILTGDEATTAVDIPWHQVRYQHTAAVRAALAERYAHSTANKMLSALRGVLKAAWRLGLMSADQYQTAVAVENVKGETVPAGRAIASGELAALMGSCEQNKIGVRDAAVIALLYGCGLRRAELVRLDLADYDPAAETLLVRGKQNKQRQMPVVSGAARALADWLLVRGHEPGPLFVGIGHNNSGGRLTTQAIYDMLQRRADRVGLTSLSPHDFRRTFVGELLDRGADIVTVQKLAGHANVTTTARYDRRGEQAKRRAAELLHVPYIGRTLEIQEQGDGAAI